MRHTKLILFLFIAFQSLLSIGKTVFIMEIKQEIDPRMSRYVDLALKEAKESKADAVVIEMDTYGGAVFDADKIRTAILDFEKPIFVFIDKNAASAGALISIACDSIYMTSGANIGAATVVNQEGEAAPDKYQSYMRSMMRSTAESNGRDPKIAEAMVDQSLEVDSISESGRVITFTTSEAIKYGFCEAELSTLDEVLEKTGYSDAEIKRFEVSESEKIISFFLNPAISGVLILIILGGIYFELQSPGIGFPLAAAVIAGILYLTPYYMNGLAENWEIIMLFIGLALIFAEVFVIPGFGVAGVAGMGLTLASLILIMLNNDALNFTFVPSDRLVLSIISVLGGAVGAGALLLFSAGKILNSSYFKKIALTETMDKKDGYTSNFTKIDLNGKTGTAYTNLSPSGKVMIEGELYEANTRGSYVEKGKEIVVIQQESTYLKVKAV